MRIFLLLAATFVFADPGVVYHPTPKKPLYIDEAWYESIKLELPPLPKPQSNEQKEDERKLFEYQKSRHNTDCEKAKAEVLVSLASFFGGPESPIVAHDVKRLTPFFEQVRNDADYFIQRLKHDFPRLRPFLYLKGLSPCVPKEVTGAYPSGHAVLSQLFALVLAELFPDKKTYLEARALKIGAHRVLAGMHHPTDIEAGRRLGTLIFQKFKASPRFLTDLQKHAKP